MTTPSVGSVAKCVWAKSYRAAAERERAKIFFRGRGRYGGGLGRRLPMRPILRLAVVTLLLVPTLVRADESGPSTGPAATKVACVGDSITWGATIKDRDHDSYPAQLGRMLGEKWLVQNFGYSGATLLKKGDRPYWKGKRFAAALDFAPDV